MALLLTVCASMAQGQSPVDSGRTASASPAAIVTNDSTGSFAGRVVQGDGTPVAGAVVSVVGAPDSVLTTTDGHFALRRVPLGARMVSVRRIGFAVKRFALTIAPGTATDVTITMTKFVPLLPTVTTTAEERAAYRSVGFDQRMKMGQGQFLTYDQIIQKQPTHFTDLLQGMRGIRFRQNPNAGMGASVEGTRGMGSCVSYAVDGVRQNLIEERTSAGERPESPDNLIEASAIGAVEVYTTAERPPEFNSTIETPDEAPSGGDVSSVGSDLGPTAPYSPGLTLPGKGGAISFNQQCVLVSIWTRNRLGLVGAQETPKGRAANTTLGKEPTRAVTTFAADSGCSPPRPRDTTDLLIYATVVGTRPDPMSETAWADYKYKVLKAIDQWADLPSELFLPSFSLPVSSQAKPGTSSNKNAPEVFVTPSLSTVLAFSLDSSGALLRARVQPRRSPTVRIRRALRCLSRRERRGRFRTCRAACVLLHST
jgi:hypothetical protein